MHPKFCTYSNNQDSRFFFHPKETCFTSTPQWHPTSHLGHPLKRPSLRTSAPYCIVATAMLGSFHQIHYLLGSNHLPSISHPSKNRCFSIFETLLIGRLMLDWLLVRRKVAVPYDRSEAKTKSAMLCSKRKMSYKSPRTPTNMTWRRLHVLMGSQL